MWTQQHVSEAEASIVEDVAMAVAVDGDDAVVVSGHVTVTGHYFDAWVAKYGADGSLLWEFSRDGVATPATTQTSSSGQFCTSGEHSAAQYAQVRVVTHTSSSSPQIAAAFFSAPAAPRSRRAPCP